MSFEKEFPSLIVKQLYNPELSVNEFVISCPQVYKHCVDKARLLRKLEELEDFYSDEAEIPTNGNDPSSNEDFICFRWDKYKEFKQLIKGGEE